MLARNEHDLGNACAVLALPVPDDEMAQLAGLCEIYTDGLKMIRELNGKVPFEPFPLPAPPMPARGSVDHRPSTSWRGRDSREVTKIFRELATLINDKGDPTNAFIGQASEPSAAPAAAGELAGAIFGVKDNIDVAGTVTTCASSLLVDSPRAKNDAPIVAAARGAGAFCVGKLNLGEFAVTFDSPVFGRVRNPWNLDRIAGGSSGGSAAAVAAGYLDFAFGTDSAGSVRMPAALCGVVGFRPTNGSLTLAGIPGPAWTVDSCGVFARHVADVAAVMDQLEWSVVPKQTGGNEPRIGVVLDESMGPLDPAVRDAYVHAVSRLEEAGHKITFISLPELELALVACAVIAYAEVGWHHHDTIRAKPDRYGGDSRVLLRLGQLFEISDYLDAQRLRYTLSRAYRDHTRGFDAIITPTVPITAPHDVSAARVAGDNTPLALFTTIRYTALANFLALPSISIPAGLASDGLPVGMQLIGEQFKDRELLALASQAETAIGFDAKPEAWWARQ